MIRGRIRGQQGIRDVQVASGIQEFSAKAEEGCVKTTDSAYNQGAVNQVFFPCASKTASSWLNNAVEGSPSSTRGLPKTRKF